MRALKKITARALLLAWFAITGACGIPGQLALVTPPNEPAPPAFPEAPTTVVELERVEPTVVYPSVGIGPGAN